jgi:hypothetical protein
LRIADFADKQPLAQRLMAFVAAWHAHAHPVQWSTKSVTKVMANVKTRWRKPHDFHPLCMGTRTKRCRCFRSSHGASPIFPHTAALGTSLGIRLFAEGDFLWSIKECWPR